MVDDMSDDLHPFLARLQQATNAHDLDLVVDCLPSPLDRPPVTGTNPKKKDKEEKRKPDPKEPFSGLVFKIVADTHGELFYVRIYSGTLKTNSRPYNPGKDTDGSGARALIELFGQLLC